MEFVVCIVHPREESTWRTDCFSWVVEDIEAANLTLKEKKGKMVHDEMHVYKRDWLHLIALWGWFCSLWCLSYVPVLRHRLSTLLIQVLIWVPISYPICGWPFIEFQSNDDVIAVWMYGSTLYACNFITESYIPLHLLAIYLIRVAIR